MDANIILVGMPASGKTTIGYLLSKKLTDYTFIDIDNLIERTVGMQICEIFEKHSEDYFRKLEYDTIKMVCSGNKKIISTGGGAFENPDSRSTLLNFGKVFYLKSDLDVLYYRISEDSTRPLLNNDNPRLVLENLLKKREENFKKAHEIVDTDEMSAEENWQYAQDKTGQSTCKACDSNCKSCDKETGKCIADVMTLNDEKIDDSKPYEIFDPDYTWKRKTIENYTCRRLLVPIFKGGELVYDLPTMSELRSYCTKEVDSLWDSVKRFENPHKYHVDLSQKLWDIKNDILHSFRKA